MKYDDVKNKKMSCEEALKLLDDPEYIRTSIMARAKKQQQARDVIRDRINRDTEIMKCVEQYIDNIKQNVLFLYRDHSKYIKAVQACLEPSLVDDEYNDKTWSTINFLFGFSKEEYIQLHKIELENKKKFLEQLIFLKNHQI